MANCASKETVLRRREIEIGVAGGRRRFWVGGSEGSKGLFIMEYVPPHPDMASFYEEVNRWTVEKSGGGDAVLVTLDKWKRNVPKTLEDLLRALNEVQTRGLKFREWIVYLHIILRRFDEADRSPEHVFLRLWMLRETFVSQWSPTLGALDISGVVWDWILERILSGFDESGVRLLANDPHFTKRAFRMMTDALEVASTTKFTEGILYRKNLLRRLIHCTRQHAWDAFNYTNDSSKPHISAYDEAEKEAMKMLGQVSKTFAERLVVLLSSYDEAANAVVQMCSFYSSEFIKLMGQLSAKQISGDSGVFQKASMAISTLALIDALSLLNVRVETMRGRIPDNSFKKLEDSRKHIKKVFEMVWELEICEDEQIIPLHLDNLCGRDAFFEKHSAKRCRRNEDTELSGRFLIVKDFILSMDRTGGFPKYFQIKRQPYFFRQMNGILDFLLVHGAKWSHWKLATETAEAADEQIRLTVECILKVILTACKLKKENNEAKIAWIAVQKNWIFRNSLHTNPVTNSIMVRVWQQMVLHSSEDVIGEYCFLHFDLMQKLQERRTTTAFGQERDAIQSLCTIVFKCTHVEGTKANLVKKAIEDWIYSLAQDFEKRITLLSIVVTTMASTLSPSPLSVVSVGTMNLLNSILRMSPRAWENIEANRDFTGMRETCLISLLNISGAICRIQQQVRESPESRASDLLVEEQSICEMNSFAVKHLDDIAPSLCIEALLYLSHALDFLGEDQLRKLEAFITTSQSARPALPMLLARDKRCLLAPPNNAKVWLKAFSEPALPLQLLAIDAFVEFSRGTSPRSHVSGSDLFKIVPHKSLIAPDRKGFADIVQKWMKGECGNQESTPRGDISFPNLCTAMSACSSLFDTIPSGDKLKLEAAFASVRGLISDITNKEDAKWCSEQIKAIDMELSKRQQNWS